MRTDYDKIICERPRRGSSNSYGEVRAKVERYRSGDEDHTLPKHMGMRKIFRQNYGVYAKEFSDYLAPLKRWLDKQVNRPWNKVKSDLHSMLDSRRTTDQHVWQHVKHWVEEHNVFVEGNDIVEYSYNRRHVLDDRSLYVDAHGILKRPRKKHVSYHGRPKAYKVPYVKDGTHVQHNQIDGIWYEVTYKWREYSGSRYFGSDTMKLIEQHIQTHWLNGEHVYLVPSSKRALSSKEIKKFRLNATR